MYPVSDRFKEALTKSHTKVTRAELYKAGELLEGDIPVVDGSITDDNRAIIRRRASLTLPATDEILALLASEAPDNGGLWPLGNELKVYSGIQFGPGDEELVPMGVFRISKPQIRGSSSELSVTIDGYDRGRAVSRARFTEPYVVDQSTNYITAIKDLIKSRLPIITDEDFITMTTNYVTPQLVFTSDDDPMQMAMNMAGSIGAEIFFDGDGYCVVQPEPDPAYDEPVAFYQAGTDATITNADRDLDDDQAYNGIIVVSENSELDAPIRAEAWDTNPNSPTYYDPDYASDSIYGPVPYFINSQYITTQQQANDAANANLARVLGIIEKVSFGAITNPAHTSGDVIYIQEDRSGINGVNLMDSITFGLGTQVTLNSETRKRRVS